MFPSPAKKCWSSKSGFIARSRECSISWNLLGVKAGSSGSSPKPEKSRWVSFTSHTRPNFRVSLKLSRQPDSKSRITRSCVATGDSDGSILRSPLMRRWQTRTDSVSVIARNFALRPISTTFCPGSNPWKASGSGSARLRSQSSRAPLMVCPIKDGAPPVPRLKFLAMVSTSGSSGTSLTH